jgi:hypothetical protein
MSGGLGQCVALLRLLWAEVYWILGPVSLTRLGGEIAPIYWDDIYWGKELINLSETGPGWLLDGEQRGMDEGALG